MAYATVKKREPDSILILRFHKAGRSWQIELIHAGMPQYDYLPIEKDWTTYYLLTTLEKYLRNRHSR